MIKCPFLSIQFYHHNLLCDVNSKKQESIPVVCEPSAVKPHVLHNEQV